MKKLVILVDDDPVFRYISSKMIEKVRPDFKIISFSQGKVALDFLRENYADEHLYYILLDINMPIMDGWKFLEAIEKIDFIKTEKVSIHIVSSSVDDSDIEKSKKYDLVQGFLHKPLSADRIKSIII
ncbi:response regulator of RpoS [Arenibacter sp. NBRC 103722]|uniref:response regulator n=1 Tax=Arenibacter sp. NBRC 103722 TaxID=1113929 RepID=UPI000853E5E0|nr:response regulator [Arenibacter sp. NBRC 103722]MDX1766470.1 response regulator [Arenibacter troitsensis]GBF22143.1 response regulator of RpoS [Arenibacter sp. NBRC 103722]|tara:strand:- start:1005 stop:1385 length:381 start_codon:yes stop_codon:yes gene_type:complete